MNTSSRYYTCLSHNRNWKETIWSLYHTGNNCLSSTLSIHWHRIETKMKTNIIYRQYIAMISHRILSTYIKIHVWQSLMRIHILSLASWAILGKRPKLESRKGRVILASTILIYIAFGSLGDIYVSCMIQFSAYSRLANVGKTTIYITITPLTKFKGVFQF